MNQKTRSMYGRMVRWLKKSSMETISRASICIWFWDGSKFEPFIFLFEIMITCFLAEVAHFFSSKMLRWLKIRREHEFEAKMIRILSHLKIKCICWHVPLSPSMTFWAISPSTRYEATWRIPSNIFLSKRIVRLIEIGYFRNNDKNS